MGTFDRVRPRTPDALDDRDLTSPALVDTDGKRALYSAASPAPALGAVTVECSSCGQESVVTLPRLARAAVPSLHLPLLKKYPSYLRCPACRRHAWVRLHFRV